MKLKTNKCMLLAEMTPGGSTDKLELGCGGQPPPSPGDTPNATPTTEVKPQRKYSTRTPAVFIGSTDFIREYKPST